MLSELFYFRTFFHGPISQGPMCGAPLHCGLTTQPCPRDLNEQVVLLKRQLTSSNRPRHAAQPSSNPGPRCEVGYHFRYRSCATVVPAPAARSAQCFQCACVTCLQSLNVDHYHLQCRQTTQCQIFHPTEVNGGARCQGRCWRVREL